MNYNKNNSCFICHKCLKPFFYKNDLQRHLNKKEICESKYNCLLSINDIINKSINKRFYFINSITINDLEKYHLISLVNNYHDKLNIIGNLSELNNKNNLITTVNNLVNNSINNTDNNLINNTDNNLVNCLINEANQIINPNNKSKSIDDFIIVIDGKKKYKCLDCNSVYKRRENFLEHLDNKELCEKRKKINNLLNKSEINTINGLSHPSQINIQNLNNNVQNNNNIQNIQNINNNSSQNNYNFELKDFIENNYSHSHIPRNAIQNKDFYLHKNFLNLIMENDENKNIYFDGKYAFVYTDGGLKRIQSDKAGYLVLEKLDKAIISYIYSNPQSLKEDFSYVDRYYSVMKNKYIFDTIHKPYNIDTKKFDYCETRNIRTRDKCLSEITQICNLHKDKTKEIMKIKEYDKYEIDANYQVNIPNYESARTRNKGFIDTGKYY